MAEAAINVALFGMEQRAADTLELAFKNNAKGVCHIADKSQAQVALFNLDAENARNLVNDFHKSNPDIPTVGMCCEPSDKWDMDQIKVPLSVIALVKAILEANSKCKIITKKELSNESKLTNHITEDKIALAMKAIESRSVAKNLNKRVDNKKTTRVIHKENAEIRFDTKFYLLGYILDATTNNNKDVISVTCWGDKFILINQQKNQVTTDLTDSQIRNLAIAGSDDELSSPITVEYLDKKSLDKLQLSRKGTKRVFTYEIFMWNLGLMTSRGRIPDDALPDERQSIRRWPNLTRVLLPDNAMRVIAYWTRNQCSLIDMHEKLNIPLQDIFTIYTAAWSANLVNVAKRETDQFLKSETLYANDNRGLFTSIVSRLRNFSTDNKSKSAQSF